MYNRFVLNETSYHGAGAVKAVARKSPQEVSRKLCRIRPRPHQVRRIESHRCSGRRWHRIRDVQRDQAQPDYSECSVRR